MWCGRMVHVGHKIAQLQDAQKCSHKKTPTPTSKHKMEWEKNKQIKP